MAQTEEQPVNRTTLTNKMAIGCTLIIVIFFIAIHIIVNFFLIPLAENTFDLLWPAILNTVIVAHKNAPLEPQLLPNLSVKLPIKTSPSI